MVTWPMTSHDPERSWKVKSWPRYVWCQYLENGWRYRLVTMSTYRKWHFGFKWSRARWRHVTLLPAHRAAGGLAKVAPTNVFVFVGVRLLIRFVYRGIEAWIHRQIRDRMYTDSRAKKTRNHVATRHCSLLECLMHHGCIKSSQLYVPGRHGGTNQADSKS